MARYKKRPLIRTGSFTNNPHLVQYEMVDDDVIKNNELYINQLTDWCEVDNMTPGIYLINIRCLVLIESIFCRRSVLNTVNNARQAHW